jgi:hypothetical protein
MERVELGPSGWALLFSAESPAAQPALQVHGGISALTVIMMVPVFKFILTMESLETVPVANGPSTHLPLSAAVRVRWSESLAAKVTALSLNPKISSDSEGASDSDSSSANELLRGVPGPVDMTQDVTRLAARQKPQIC